MLENNTPVFFFPLPGVGQKLVPCKFSFVDALFFEHLNHFGFGGNARVVGTGYPTGIFAFHAGLAGQHILNGVIEHMAHVQHTRHVGGWNHDGVRLPVVGY